MDNFILRSKIKLDLEDVGRHKPLFQENAGLHGVNGLFNFSLLTTPSWPSGQISSPSLHRARAGHRVHRFD